MSGSARRHAIAAVLVAFAVRVAAGLAVAPESSARGFDFYGFMAQNLVQGKGLCWWFYEGLGLKFANRAPLYPIVLAGIMQVAGAAWTTAMIWVQSAIGAGAIFATGALARRWSGERAATFALWGGALWPYSVVTDTGMVEHVIYAPTCVLALWAALEAASPGARPHRAFTAGVVAGVAALSRITFVLSLPFVGLALVRRLGAARTVLFGAGLAIVLAPWVVRNHEVTGKYVLGTDGGRALLVGCHPATYVHYPKLSIDEGEREIFRRISPELAAELRGLAGDEIAQDARFRDVAIGVIRDDPAAFAGRMVRKAGALWSVVYNPGPASAAKMAIFAATLVLLLAGAAAGAVVCARMRADLPAVLLLFASFTAVAMVFWGQPRYLAPLHGIGIAMTAAWLARRPETPR